MSRYTGVEQNQAPLNHLGSNKWQKAKRKAAEQIRDVAADAVITGISLSTFTLSCVFLLFPLSLAHPPHIDKSTLVSLSLHPVTPGRGKEREKGRKQE